LFSSRRDSSVGSTVRNYLNHWMYREWGSILVIQHPYYSPCSIVVRDVACGAESELWVPSSFVQVHEVPGLK
jgi:hypothetical protein